MHEDISESRRPRLFSYCARFVLHLRLKFNYVLAPLFVWGAFISGASPEWRFWLGFVAFHVFLYGGTNMFNSYYDRDDGPIGGLERPPPVDRGFLIGSLTLKVIGLLLACGVGGAFVVCYLLFVAYSVCYSHPAIRIKKRLCQRAHRLRRARNRRLRGGLACSRWCALGYAGGDGVGRRIGGRGDCQWHLSAYPDLPTGRRPTPIRHDARSMAGNEEFILLYHRVAQRRWRVRCIRFRTERLTGGEYNTDRLFSGNPDLPHTIQQACAAACASSSLPANHATQLRQLHGLAHPARYPLMGAAQ
jgi:hypothetical protein